MQAFLDFFNLKDVGAFLLLICLLRFVGAQMGSREALWPARLIGGLMFFAYGAMGYETWLPTDVRGFAELTARSLLAMATVYSAMTTISPTLVFLFRHLWQEPMLRHREWQEEQERLEKEEDEKRQKEEEAKRQRAEYEEAARIRREELAKLPPPPPPPTQDELLASARRDLERTCAWLDKSGLGEIELRAAKEQAKRKYLRRVDDLMH